MHKDVRPLYTLTVEEFKELSKTIALDYRYLLLPDETVQESKSDIIYLVRRQTKVDFSLVGVSC